MRAQLLPRAALSVLAAGLLALAAGPAAARPLALRRGSAYLALGDSITFGSQESNVVPTPNDRHAASSVGYPEHIAFEFPRVSVVNAACPGETAASFVTPTAVSNGCENARGRPGGWRNVFPLHVHYTGSQLAFAVHYLRTRPNVRLVSLMIGLNDVLLCQETTRDRCRSLAQRRAALTSIRRNVATILHTIRAVAGYTGQIVIVNYYAAVDRAFPAPTINRAEDTAAAPFGVEIADGYGIWRTAARAFGGDPCLAGLLTEWDRTTCGIHPSDAGQALLAGAVLRAARH